MGTMPASQAARLRRGGPVMRGGLAAIAMITLALAAGCASGPAAQPSASASSSASGTGSGNVTSGNKDGSQGNEAAGSYTLAFAKCMRAHGVPNFPDPNGQGGELGPGSGINPSSQQFQAAVNGPCLSLAPAGWVSSGSGPVTR